MGLLDTLGLKAKGTAAGPAPRKPASTAGSKAAAPLQDADFAADARRRKAADDEARRLGKQRLDAKRPEPGKGLPVDPLDAQVDKLIGDPQQRLEAMAEWKVPTFSAQFDADTPEIRFLADLESGTKKASEYVEYIRQVADYAEKAGDLKALQGIGPAAQGLKKISGRILSGLGTFGKVVDKAKKIARWCVALDGFADASLAMDAADRESVKRWVMSIERLWNATAPFLEWLQSKAVTAALGGSEAAGAAGATLAIVGAELFVGIKALEAGVKNVDAYFARLDERMREIDGKPPKAAPRPPEAPGEWTTREELVRSLRRHEDEELRRRIARARNSAQAKKDEEAAATREGFDERVFPTLYLEYRASLRDRIYADYRKAGGDPKSAPALWWDCLVADDTPVEIDEDGRGSADERDGLEIEKRKTTIDLEDAGIEVRQFLELATPCPYFQVVHEGELKKYLGRGR